MEKREKEGLYMEKPDKHYLHHVIKVNINSNRSCA